MIKGVLFDLDGTLLQTIPDIAASMNRVLERLSCLFTLKKTIRLFWETVQKS